MRLNSGMRIIFPIAIGKDSKPLCYTSVKDAVLSMTIPVPNVELSGGAPLHGAASAGTKG